MTTSEPIDGTYDILLPWFIQLLAGSPFVWIHTEARIANFQYYTRALSSVPISRSNTHICDILGLFNCIVSSHFKH